jgi:hypothetical protein
VQVRARRMAISVQTIINSTALTGAPEPVSTFRG